MHCVLIGKMGAVHLKPSGSKEFVVYSSQVLVCLEWVRHNAGHPLRQILNSYAVDDKRT